MKRLLFISLTLFFASARGQNQPMVIFETDSFIIKSDTNALFYLLDKNYAESESNEARKKLIRSEVRYRLSVSENNQAKMDRLSLNCYTDKERISYVGYCLTHNEPLVLMQTGQAKVFYKNTLQEITSYKAERRGSRFRGKIEWLYIDKTTNKIFFRQLVYKHKWWKPKEGREY